MYALNTLGGSRIEPRIPRQRELAVAATSGQEVPDSGPQRLAIRGIRLILAVYLLPLLLIVATLTVAFTLAGHILDALRGSQPGADRALPRDDRDDAENLALRASPDTLRHDWFHLN